MDRKNKEEGVIPLLSPASVHTGPHTAAPKGEPTDVIRRLHRAIGR